ncbi:MAG: hypothetical protein PHV17_09010 [Candidatus Omnitrophica bacterium]|nr:hypothetical protein [Candidatus Omnitrophota bacterium]
MNKGKKPHLTGSNLDSARLKEAFFTPLKEEAKPEKKNNKISKKIFLSVIFILALIFLSLVSHYDFVLIPKMQAQNKNAISLFSKEASTIKFNDSDDWKKPLYIQIANEEKNKITLNFKEPLDLHDKPVSLYLKKSKSPIMITVTAKDSRFFSNSRTPKKLIIDENDASTYIKIPITFEPEILQNTNLYRISQLKFDFNGINEKDYDSEQKIASQPKNWVLVKDILLVKEEKE